jgi:hypothetical protein
MSADRVTNSFFVDLKARFPTRHSAKPSRAESCPSCPPLRRAGLGLDKFQAQRHIECSRDGSTRWRLEGNPLSGTDRSCHNLGYGRSKDRMMMQPCGRTSCPALSALFPPSMQTDLTISSRRSRASSMGAAAWAASSTAPALALSNSDPLVRPPKMRR